MKKYFFLIGIFLSLKGFSQDQIKWTFNANKISADTYEVHLRANLQPPWHIYSQYMEKGGPIPTKITFNDAPSILLVDSAKEIGKRFSQHVEVFNVNVKYYADSVDFVQLVKLKDKASAEVSGTIKFMICTEDHCMPPAEVPFTVKLQ